jgi:hypothetical protein
MVRKMETIDGGDAGFLKAVSQKKYQPIGPWPNIWGDSLGMTGN